MPLVEVSVGPGPWEEASHVPGDPKWDFSRVPSLAANYSSPTQGLRGFTWAASHLPRLGAVRDADLRAQAGSLLTKLNREALTPATASAVVAAVVATGQRSSAPSTDVSSAVAQLVAHLLARKRFGDGRLLADAGVAAGLRSALLDQLAVVAALMAGGGPALEPALAALQGAGRALDVAFWRGVAEGVRGAPHMSVLLPLAPFLLQLPAEELGATAITSVLLAALHGGSAQWAGQALDVLGGVVQGGVPGWWEGGGGDHLTPRTRLLVWAVLDALAMGVHQATPAFGGYEGGSRPGHFNTAGAAFNGLLALAAQEDFSAVPLWAALSSRLLSAGVVALPAPSPWLRQCTPKPAPRQAQEAEAAAALDPTLRPVPWPRSSSRGNVPLDAMVAVAVDQGQKAAAGGGAAPPLTPGAMQKLAALCTTGHDGCSLETLAWVVQARPRIVPLLHDGACRSSEAEVPAGLLVQGDVTEGCAGGPSHPSVTYLYALLRTAPPAVALTPWHDTVRRCARLAREGEALAPVPGSPLFLAPDVFRAGFAALTALPTPQHEAAQPALHPALAAVTLHVDGSIAWHADAVAEQAEAGHVEDAAALVAQLGAVTSGAQRAALRMGAVTAVALLSSSLVGAWRRLRHSALPTAAPAAWAELTSEVLVQLGQGVEFAAGMGPHAALAGPSGGAGAPPLLLTSPPDHQTTGASAVDASLRALRLVCAGALRVEGGTSAPLDPAAAESAAALRGLASAMAELAAVPGVPLQRIVQVVLALDCADQLPGLLSPAAAQQGGPSDAPPPCSATAFLDLVQLCQASLAADERRGGGPAGLPWIHARSLALVLLRWVAAGAVEPSTPDMPRHISELASAVTAAEERRLARGKRGAGAAPGK